MRLLILTTLFIFSCSDHESLSHLNEVQVYSDVCEFSFTLKTKTYSTGRYDSDCKYEEIARFNNISADTIHYEAKAGKRKTVGKIYHAGRITEIEIDF